MNGYRSRDRRHVAWDIETTGLAHSDELTVVGLWLPDGRAKLALNCAGDAVAVDGIEETLSTVSGGVTVDVVACEDERETLERLGELRFEYVERSRDRLVAFNADSWQGGFDLPFLRTRCARLGVGWPLDGLTFADLWEPVTKRLNTSYAGFGSTEETNSLDGAHRVLAARDGGARSVAGVPADHPWYAEERYDPLDDSREAAACHARGDHGRVCQHNLADIHRTWELGELVREFVPAGDISEKKL